MRIFLLVLLLFPALATRLTAQRAPEKGNRMIFAPGATEPIITGSVATPDVTGQSAVGEPGEIMKMFFLSLKAGKVDAAYDALVRGTIIASRVEDVTALKTRTKTALDSYGPVSGYEAIDERAVGTVLMRKTCVSLNSDLPLRWRFYFYKSGGIWRLVDLRVDDGLVELFEDSGRAAK